MESNTGADPVRTVRIPDELWQRLTRWAEDAGVGNSEALRALLHLGTQETGELQFRPSFKWMHDHKRTGKRYGVWLFAHVSTGSNWSDLDDVLSKVPGATPVLGKGMQRWHVVPESQENTLRALFGSLGGRLRVHLVDLGDAPIGT